MVVVGTAAHDDAAAAEAALRELRSAVVDRHPRFAWRFVVSEGRSTGGHGDDATRDVLAAAYALQPNDLLNVPYHGQPGRARAIQAILREARKQGAAGCLVVDRPAAACPPDWIDGFVEGIAAQNLDFVSPLYARHPFSGGLIRGIVYPLMRALYGVRLQYPIGHHFACSAKFIEAVLPDAIWESEAGQIGIDLWTAATAASADFRVGEAIVGAPAVEEPQAVDLGTTIAQVIGFLFTDMERRVRAWQRVRGSRAVPRLGSSAAPAPAPPGTDIASLVETFRLAFRELQEVWTEILPPLAFLQWRRLASQPLETFRVNDALWARSIYDFAMAHRLRVIARDHLLRSLTPMYLAWLASFIMDVQFAPLEATEARLERLCHAFEAEKPYLVSQWRWPERFKPVKMRR